MHNGHRDRILRRHVSHNSHLRGVAKPISLFVEFFRIEMGSLTADDVTYVLMVEFIAVAATPAATYADLVRHIHEIQLANDNNNDHSFSHLPVHYALTCPKGQRAWGMAPLQLEKEICSMQKKTYRRGPSLGRDSIRLSRNVKMWKTACTKQADRRPHASQGALVASKQKGLTISGHILKTCLGGPAHVTVARSNGSAARNPTLTSRPPSNRNPQPNTDKWARQMPQSNRERKKENDPRPFGSGARRKCPDR